MICGMVGSEAPSAVGEKPAVAATMFGVTTPCVTIAAAYARGARYEVPDFDATGGGGRAMEQ